MTKYILKTIILTGFIFTTIIAKAQVGYMYSRWEIGASGAANQVYGDAQTITTTASVHLNLTYSTSPFVNYVFEVQAGKLEGGNALKDTTGRQFSNSFTAFLFRGQLQLGELIDYSQSPVGNAFKNLYLSTGIGYMVNHLTTNRFSYKIPDFYTPGEDNSTELFIPVRVGYEFKIFNQYNEPSVKIDLAYEYNYMFGDELDGFKAGVSNDKYTTFSIGVKFAIGGDITSYRKPISY